MSQVNVNLDELRKFAYFLNKLSMDLRTNHTITLYKMNHINDTWRDVENKKFMERFQKDLQPLKQLITTMEEYSRFLERKANALEKYLNSR